MHCEKCGSPQTNRLKSCQNGTMSKRFFTSTIIINSGNSRGPSSTTPYQLLETPQNI